jgi:hypothetical protein
MNHPILLADIFELFGGVAGLIFLVMWVIKQIVEANKQAAPPRGRPPVAQQPQAKPAVQAAGRQADPLRDQVEDFLRRAGRGPQAGQPGPAQRRARPVGGSEIEVLVDEAALPSQRGPLAEPLRPVDQPIAAPLSQSSSTTGKPRPQRKNISQRRETVAEHVTENVAAPSRAVAEQAARLGQRIIEEDHQFDVQLKAKFDHTVGTLTESTVTVAEQAAAGSANTTTPAMQIAAMLANPDGVRQAIILNEILHRPADRW